MPSIGISQTPSKAVEVGTWPKARSAGAGGVDPRRTVKGPQRRVAAYRPSTFCAIVALCIVVIHKIKGEAE
jgi:hypothetical protein